MYKKGSFLADHTDFANENERLKIAPSGQNMNNPGFQTGEKGTQKNPAAIKCSSKNKPSFGRKREKPPLTPPKEGNE